MLKIILAEDDGMATNSATQRQIDLARHTRNKGQVPPEYLIPFWRKQVAWNAEGTRIVAAATTDAALLVELQRLGISPQEVVFGYVDDPEVGNF